MRKNTLTEHLLELHSHHFSCSSQLFQAVRPPTVHYLLWTKQQTDKVIDWLGLRIGLRMAYCLCFHASCYNTQYLAVPVLKHYIVSCQSK